MFDEVYFFMDPAALLLLGFTCVALLYFLILYSAFHPNSNPSQNKPVP